MKSLKLLMVFGLIFGGIITARAEMKPLVNKNDVIGCYERINFSPELTKQMNPVEYWSDPYQWFCFKKDGTFFNVMSVYYQRHTTKSLQRALKLPLPVSRYDVLSKDMIKIEGANIQEETYWQVSLSDRIFVASDGTVIPKKTMVMGLIDPKRGTVVYWRYLKRLK